MPELLSALIHSVSNELNKLTEVKNSTRSYSNSDDLKQEGKYDTRAIEANYLAGAQEKRVQELTLTLNYFKNLNQKQNHKEATGQIQVGSLIELESQKRKSYYFIAELGGGMSFTFQDMKISILSTASPLGQEVLELEEGDEFEFENGLQVKEIKVNRILN